ncbi:MAG: acetate--CoA ligase family protein [Candidatus Brocadiae bacterium]|nr:acetate--CoA ligase family protein [Candidatus Brocadiia bacterium]
MLNPEIIHPSSIAVIGGSNDTSKVGGKVLENLLAGKFPGKLYVVNPKEDVVLGVKSYKNVEDLPEVSLAIFCIAAKFTKSSVEILAATKKTKAFIILSAGFSETGSQGAELEREIVEIIEKHNACLIGPNCIGVLTQHYNGIFAGPIPKLNPKGCDFVSGSGATAVFIIEKGMPMGLSFASLFSVGNSAQIGVEEVVQYWDETFDPETSSKTKLIYLEDIHKPELLLKHASSLIQKGCSIAAVKAGSSEAGSRAASSHTGAMASPDKAVDALFKKAGIIRCYGREDLVQTAGILTLPRLKGNNIAIVTHAGGPGVMLTDALCAGGMHIPHLSGEAANELLQKLYPGSCTGNPIDFLATGTAEQLGIILDFMENQFPEIDGTCVIFGTPGLFDVSPVYKVLSEKMKSTQKTIFPILPSIVQASKAIEYFKSLGHVFFSDEVIFGRNLANVQKTARPAPKALMPEIDRKTIRNVIESSPDGYLSPESLQKLLDACGIERAQEALVHTKESLSQALEKIPAPWVMKVVGPLHKSDVGGVILNIKDKNKAQEAYNHLISIPYATGVLVQNMLQGTELFLGAKYEEKFGHLVMCGLGGIFIEVFQDIACALSPVSQEEAASMMKSLKSYKIIQGVRGQEGVNQEKFINAIVRLSALLEAAPEIQEMDLNPLLGNSKAIIAVDCRIRISHKHQ